MKMKEKKIKILHLFYIGGGISTSIRLIAENSNPKNFEHIIVNGTKDSEGQELNLKNSKVYNIKFRREISFFRDIILFYKTLKICLKENPGIIHGHSSKGGIISKFVGFFTNTPCLHTPQAYSYLSSNNKIKKHIYLQIERILKILPHKILASSKSEESRALTDLNYVKKRVFTFSNSIPEIRHINNLQLEFSLPAEFICSVGRPSYQKNIEFMIDVLHDIKKERPNIHLVIMGVGYYSPNLYSVKQKIQDLNLQENVTMLDWISRQDIFSIVKSSQLYISTARYEGLPYAVIEALALKKALVLSNVDGNRDLVDDNKNGFLVDENDLEGFRDKVLDLLENHKKRKEFELNSYNKFKASFDISKTISQLEQIYFKESSKE
jgi:glycosyltransferase involved in cell wall biosynthesis